MMTPEVIYLSIIHMLQLMWNWQILMRRYFIIPVTTPVLQQYPVKRQGLLILYLGLYLLHIEGGLAVHPGKESNVSIIMVVSALNQTKVWCFCYIVDQMIILKEVILLIFNIVRWHSKNKNIKAKIKFMLLAYSSA